MHLLRLQLAVLVCCSLLCKPLLALEECLCWDEPDPTSGECGDNQLPLVYSSREFTETYTQCVDRVAYDPEYGGLQASLCWNRACLPERFQRQTVAVELNLGEEELKGMSEGNYTSDFVGKPSLDGISLRTSVLAFKQREQGAEEVSVAGDDAILTVPEGGLTRLRIAWEWPGQLNATEAGSNQAFVIIRNSSLSGVPLTWPGFQNARNLTSTDLCEAVQAVGEETEGKSCDKGKVGLRVTRDPGFVGVNAGNVEIEPEDVSALLCVDPPKYDKYTQLLEWGFAWDLNCWESRAEPSVPLVFRMEAVPSEEDIAGSALDGLGMPTYARLQLLTRGEQMYRLVGDESPQPALSPYFSVRQVNVGFFDGNGGIFPIGTISSDNVSFTFPEEGITAFMLDTKLMSPDEEATPGQVRYLGLITVPGKQMDSTPHKLKDKYTLIDYNATIAIKGQHFNDIKPWVSILGVRASIQSVGWAISVPVLLRGNRVLASCSEEDVDDFLLRLANATDIERSDLNATCLELPPGQAIGYTQHLQSNEAEPSYNITVPNVGGQPTLNRCSDARFGLNITYNTVLPPELRSQRKRVPTESESDFEDDFATSTFSASSSKAKSSRTKNAAKVDPAKMPKVRPLEEGEGNKRRTLLQDDEQDGEAPSLPRTVEAWLRQAALNLNVLFSEEEYGGREQYCVHPIGMVSTLVSIEDSILRSKKVAEEGGIPDIPREGNRIIIGNQTKMDKICMSTVESAVERLQIFLGQESPMDVNVLTVTGCYGETNCIDCWPYKVLEIYQIVLIVCAFCLSVIAILGVRAYMVMSVANMTKTLRPGYLNDEGTIERLIREQEELDFDDIVD